MTGASIDTSFDVVLKRPIIDIGAYIRRGIKTVAIDKNGHLIFELTDGTSADLGKVVGEDGVGIKGISQISESTEDKGINKILFTLTNGEEFIINIRNGSKGDIGETGVSPTVSVVETADGYDIEITDAEGSHQLSLKHGKDGNEGDVVLYTDQDLTEEQKTKARENISAQIAPLNITVTDNLANYSSSEIAAHVAQGGDVYLYIGDILYSNDGGTADLWFFKFVTTNASGALEINEAQIYVDNKVVFDTYEVASGGGTTDSVLYTEQTLTDEQKAQARENIGIEVPDWDQADETAVDYIKNRTHYKHIADEELLPTTLIDTSTYDDVDFKFIPNETYLVVFDGVEYELVATNWEDEYNGVGAMWGGDYTDIPFGLCTSDYQDGFSIYAQDSNSEHELTIIRKNAEIIKKLPEEYIPDIIYEGISYAAGRANDAHSKATTAQSTADEAKSNATNAQTTAEQAQATADSIFTIVSNSPFRGAMSIGQQELTDGRLFCVIPTNADTTSYSANIKVIVSDALQTKYIYMRKLGSVNEVLLNKITARNLFKANVPIMLQYCASGDYFIYLNDFNADFITSHLSNTTMHITAEERTAWNAKSDFSGSYNDLTDQPTIPSNTSDLTNDSNFITNAVSDLANYYLKSETYTRDEVKALISAIPKFSIEVVDSLPTADISTTTVYLLKSGEETDNLYTEYIYVNGYWEYLGKQTVDLTGYALKTEVSVKMDKVSGGTSGNFITLDADGNAVDSGKNSNSFTPMSVLNNVISPHITNTDIHITADERTAWNAKSDFSGSYNDLTDKPTIPTVPTKLSEFDNDAGYLTSVPSEYVTENELSNKGYALKSSAETWTFTLKDGSTVTKKVVLA